MRIAPIANPPPLSRVTTVLSLLFAALLALPAAASMGGGDGGGSSGGSKKDPTPFYQRGVENLKTGQYEAAQKEFKEVLKIIPNHGQANYLMGMALEGQQNFKDAARAFKKAAKNDPKLYEARARLGIVSLQLGDLDDANEELADLQKAKDKCAAKCPADEQAKIQAALDALNAALQGKPAAKASALPATRADGEQRYLAAVELIHRERYAAAIKSLRQSEAAFGPTADLFNYLGFAHRKLGKFDEAHSYYAQALLIDPEHLGANEYLGELHLQMGRVDLALVQLQKLRQLCAFGCAEEEELRRWLATR
ncbi:MAG: tetratricopeptide repeat protein [Panacagrimonas sp.]